MNFDPDVLKRFFNGEYSWEDYNKLKSAFRNHESRLILTKHIENHWDEFSIGEMPPGNIDYLFEKIQHSIKLEEQNSRRIQLFRIYQKFAAILLLPLILSFFAFLYFQNNEIKYPQITPQNNIHYAEMQCPLGMRLEFQLPDGTKGFLNSGARLRYQPNFTEGRNVIVSGEAFFDVLQDKQNPFVVNTSNLSITVTGTTFNVIAYEDEQIEEVILQSGNVEVATLDGTKLAVLQPNSKLSLDTEKRNYNISDVEASQYIGWTEGKLLFRNETMKLVAERLERWYNVEIIIKDQQLLDYSFHATFIDESLEEVLKYMALTTPYKYKFLPRKINEDNIHTKKTVMISMDHERLDAFQ